MQLTLINPIVEVHTKLDIALLAIDNYIIVSFSRIFSYDAFSR